MYTQYILKRAWTGCQMTSKYILPSIIIITIMAKIKLTVVIDNHGVLLLMCQLLVEQETRTGQHKDKVIDAISLP